MQVSKWGNSLALRLPASVVEELGLKPGDEVKVRAISAHDFEVARAPSREDLMEKLRTFEGKLPADFIFNRDEANERR
ncbi:AbrB/MazE/SpoVT family DNA-binding domain-containing protein [Rhizobium sp. TRM95796]|uniref:AbrB/MazE/SpoVT family DNA-binding domain-containing protein n=1 Tax=Rhizobium sp. TRM95796 TaxID=2979862 RepID=UPI0021E98022|nr:AbrB/MazE/SpoVT family DNA-binding domain-containing protein [Rhizobium sp. TRM95796]MCV3764923.1 AbrB/MazE/SpoVT family DNA-binding domain-containing protein [Rhizobium sp. TRM95796]